MSLCPHSPAVVRPAVPMGERLSIGRTRWPVMVIFFGRCGRIYRGWSTPTEGLGLLGAAGTGLQLLAGSLKLGGWREQSVGNGQSHKGK